MRAHTAKAWNCLPENKFPPSAPVLHSFQKQERGWQKKWSLCLGCWGQATDSGVPPLYQEPRGAPGLSLLRVGQRGLHPALRGVRAGLLAHCTSLCIPSLFPMQIKLMRIRNIMEPIHRSSRWKMGLTTNFPLQLFCNYRGILWILMETRTCLTASPRLFFPKKDFSKRRNQMKLKSYITQEPISSSSPLGGPPWR